MYLPVIFKRSHLERLVRKNWVSFPQSCFLPCRAPVFARSWLPWSLLPPLTPCVRLTCSLMARPSCFARSLHSTLRADVNRVFFRLCLCCADTYLAARSRRIFNLVSSVSSTWIGHTVSFMGRSSFAGWVFVSMKLFWVLFVCILITKIWRHIHQFV